MTLHGRVALVTGGAGGIGHALGRALAAEGARVALADLDGEAARAAALDLNGLGVGLDVTDAAAVEEAVEEVERQLGGVDILANVAGVSGGHGGLLSLPMEAFDAAFDVNLRGAVLVTRAVAARMVESDRQGAILNVSSAGAVRVGGPLWHYAASKAALNAVTEAAALEFAEHGIRVNAIAPGPVYTPMTSARFDDPDVRAEWEARIPLRRVAAIEDLIPLMMLLVSDEARNITGAIMANDGGVTAG